MFSKWYISCPPTHYTKVLRMPNDPAVVCARSVIDWETVSRAMVYHNGRNGVHICSSAQNNAGNGGDNNLPDAVNTLYSRVISPPNGAARLAAYAAETCNTPVRVLGCADENIVIAPPPRLVRQRSEWPTGTMRRSLERGFWCGFMSKQE